jgi:ABC-type sugar transport system substrate-binding protein
MSRFRKLFLILSAVAVLACIAAKAQADPITIVGTQTGNFSTATVDCVFDSATNTLTFTITNTPGLTQPGSTSTTITGVGFDLPPEPSTMLLLGSALIGLGGVARRRLKPRD